MWHNTRRGHNLIRKRYSTRRFRLNVANICIITACLFVIAFAGLGIYKLTDKHIVLDKADSTIIETNASTNTSKDDKVQIYQEDEQLKPEEKTFSVAFLGELMMGGEIGESLNYNYMSAFKSIAEYTSKADYTTVNLATNVIDLDKLEDTKSKYIVTKNIENVFNALGVDGINIANDHIMDFGKDVFKDTVSILEKDYDLIGLKDTIVYAEHDGIKIAIIGVCNEVIGSESKYTNAGIMMYNMKTLKSMIKEAKKNVNTVVMLTHLGLENTHTVTSIMSWFYKELIKAGADAVFGSHALGLYPIEIYKGKPIIYSMGSLMSDTNYSIGKETGIFTINLDENGNLTSLEILPLYINAKKQTLLYSEYDAEKNSALLKLLTKNLEDNAYRILNSTVTIDVK